jgi:DNA-directed RNA polymerase specialized sigma subunit
MAMPSQNISQELKTFIKEQIHSVFSLEVLLLLHREQSRSFTASEVANELGIEIDVKQQLSELKSANLLGTTSAGSSNYYYAPANKELASIVDQLSVAYSKQRVPILSLILAEHPDRIRGFAEAFRLIGNH